MPRTPTPRKLSTRLLAAVAGALALAALAGAAPAASPPGGKLVTTSPAGTKQVASVTWAVYRDVNSLDPIYAFDYPENTAVSLMCESLLRQAPNGAIGPGLATLATPSPTKFVFTLKRGVTFWDGKPVTPADVVYSLDRNTDPKLGGFYGASFDRVKSIAATGPNQVTITLKQPDYWLEGELASVESVIVEKAYVQKEGKKFGTPTGGTMCTGAYAFQSWSPGVGVTAVANTHYWNSAVKPLVGKIVLKGAPNVASYTSALLTNGIQGSFTFALPTLDQLEKSSEVKVYQGPAWSTDAFIVSNLKGPLGDVRVRRALSLALDRQGIISSVYKGAALLPRWQSNPGTFGYAKSVFQKAYNASPVLAHNVALAKKLVAQAGATGKTITLGMSSELQNIAAVAGAFQSAGQALGLHVKFKAVSAQNYINFFTDPKARKGIDGFYTVNYGDYADPAAMLATYVLPNGSQNYDGFNDPKITALMEKARSTANPDARARLVIQVEKLANKELPWIPDVQPTNILVLNKSLTGAVASFAYMFAPWADRLGGVG
jgi:peptide/nickel transport system substrate-binding protein